ncbi:TorD/DmsD family molecular chaperone, partial [Escherichia sp. HC-CC]
PTAANAFPAIDSLPWGYRYLELLQRNPVSAFYAKLAQIATLFLQDYQQQQALNPPTKRLFLG